MIIPKRIKLEKLWIILPVLLLTGLMGCGKKGPLKLDPPKLPVKIRNIQIRQVGTEIKLNWTYPTLLSDKKTRLEKEKIRKIRIYYIGKKTTPKKFKKKADLIQKLEPKNLKTEDKMYTVAIPFKVKNLEKKDHSFAIRYVYERKKSPLSSIVFIQTVIPTKPITDLSLKKENKVIKLKWTRPVLNLSNRTVDMITGYRIYRKVKKGPFLLINKENVLNEAYQDKDTGRDGEYFYRVSAVISKEIESEASNIASVKMKDIFPPDPPSNLISFKAEDHIFLTWNPAGDRDLAYYKVFRKTDPEGEYELIADKLKQNFYKDTAVKKGISYIYTVSAVDQKGNESQNSNVVQEDL